MSHYGAGVVVFRLEVVENLGIVTLPQPIIGVDPHVPVFFERFGDLFGHGCEDRPVAWVS